VNCATCPGEGVIPQALKNQSIGIFQLRSVIWTVRSDPDTFPRCLRGISQGAIGNCIRRVRNIRVDRRPDVQPPRFLMQTTHPARETPGIHTGCLIPLARVSIIAKAPDIHLPPTSMSTTPTTPSVCVCNLILFPVHPSLRTCRPRPLLDASQNVAQDCRAPSQTPLSPTAHRTIPVCTLPFSLPHPKFVPI
jgi:hypothetical protein